MQYRIIDTNVPLTAAGYNDVATNVCRKSCLEFLERVLSGEIVVVIDSGNEALYELANNVPDYERSENIAGRFLIYLFNNLLNKSLVRTFEIHKSNSGEYVDFPDNEGNWRTNDPKCRRFDQDDKKWVALAVRFKKDTGSVAPIVNASDRCWQVFELYLNSVGLELEFLCPDQTPTN